MRRWLKTFATFVLVTLAGVSVDASAYARAWETESARRGFAAVLRNASSEIADVTIDRIKEKVLSAVRCTSDCPNQAYAQVIEESTQQGTAPAAVSALYTFGDDRISQFRPAQVGSNNSPGVTASLRYYHADGLGSTRLLTSETGSQTDVYGYEAFGETDSAISQQTSANDFLHTGEQRDSNSGFYYLRARYMNPASGLFSQRDAWDGNDRRPVSLNKYLYADQSPATNTDPSGHMSLGEMSMVSNVTNALDITPASEFAQRFRRVVDDSADRIYQFHSAGFDRYGGPLRRSIPVVSGSAYGGQVTISQTVGANHAEGVELQDVTDFITGVESYWNRPSLISPSKFVYSIHVNLIPVDGTAADIPINRSALTNVDGSCRARTHFRGYATYNTEYRLELCAGGNGGTAAHEYGHILGFDDGYEDLPGGGSKTLTSDTDLMASSQLGDVQWYHGRLLIERYKGRSR
ncbi:RHS repeat-associated core domain-containing protein [Tahibacter amnicola]|uniref:RHS repeat-associated protein n=1 Tax=Tahibacter amnicola TaxID=2976241 RepID=A0ABY6BDF1_9GAMM|nr:RHS repeat-associated core domain-containing protein [Tahibacter amnicola]UXI68061.1 hypothetical protein N4264_25600 [Tahibacter amnicola]